MWTNVSWQNTASHSLLHMAALVTSHDDEFREVLPLHSVSQSTARDGMPDVIIQHQ